MKYSLVLGIALLLAGCAGVPVTPEGFRYKEVATEYLSVAVWERDISAGRPIRFYIEGDGDPAPKNAVALKMAAKDAYQNVVYVSRPCQYVQSAVCKHKNLWREDRFNPDVVAQMEEIIRYIATKYRAPSVELVGYDGGATMALLLADKLPVTKIVTIAGILDTDAYTTFHQLPPIDGINPIEYRTALAKIPQIHYVGENDKQTTSFMAERFVHKLPNPVSAEVKSVAGVGHADWEHVRLDY
ncbi:MAG: hypothetical protein PHX68_00185 [Alphaproteobacteria bacterium]|nr:hypothetical protein [Alphaproteobacteria bacterium]